MNFLEPDGRKRVAADPVIEEFAELGSACRFEMFLELLCRDFLAGKLPAERVGGFIEHSWRKPLPQFVQRPNAFVRGLAIPGIAAVIAAKITQDDRTQVGRLAVFGELRAERVQLQRQPIALGITQFSIRRFLAIGVFERRDRLVLGECCRQPGVGISLGKDRSVPGRHGVRRFVAGARGRRIIANLFRQIDDSEIRQAPGLRRRAAVQ